MSSPSYPALEATQSELIELKNKFDAEAAARWAGVVGRGAMGRGVVGRCVVGRGALSRGALGGLSTLAGVVNTLICL